MNRFLCTLLMVLVCHIVKAQANVESLMAEMPDMGDNIYLTAVIPDESAYPKEALSLLYNNMNRFISNHGVLNINEGARFFLATNYNVITKDIVPGMPVRVSETIQCNFVIGDALTEKVFSTLSVQVKGVGINDNKALITAIQAIKWKSDEFDDFIKKGKIEIVKFFTAEAPHILQEADVLSKTGKYQEAIGKLISVPSACPQYKECMQKALTTYLKMADSQAATYLRKAKAEWAASPDREGAQKSIAYIDSIPPETKYESEVNSLLNTINNKVSSLDRQEWQFKKQQYADSIRHKKAEEQAELMKVYEAKHPYTTKSFSRSSQSGLAQTQAGGKNIFEKLADKWNAQPTWKKVLIGGGVGLAVAGGLTLSAVSSAASAVLSRSIFVFGL